MDFNNDDGVVVDPLLPVEEEEAVDPEVAEPAEESEEDESPVSVYDMNDDGELEPA